MEKKQTIYKIKGMSRDLNNMSFDKEHSFENKNIRITADRDNGLLSITNEKGTDIIFEEDILKLNKLTFISEPSDTGYTHTIKLEYPVPTGETVDIDISSYTSNYYSFHEGEDTIIINDVSFELKEVFIAGINSSETYYYWSESDLELNDQSSVNVMLKISTIIGYATVDNSIILFTTTEEDLVYKDFILSIQVDPKSTDPLYKGNLNFSTKHPIETLVDIENENLKKVYWVDGINPLRVININKKYSSGSEDPFAFVLPIKTNHIFSVEKGEPVGQFPAGVIQYAFTYFNKFGQESAVVDVSPIYYIAHEDRGASPEDIVTTSFNLTFSNLDNNWEYIRIYSIIRTSLNTTPEIKKIVDLPLAAEIEYIDSNTYGENVAPTDLLYKGGEVLAASTIAQKDSTLFLGDITIQNNIVLGDVKDLILELKLPYIELSKTLTIGRKPLYNGQYNSEESTGTFYDYINNLNKNNREITTFKGGETYRLGVQLQDKYGKWSDPIFIGDKRNELYPQEQEVSDGGTIVKLPEFKLNIGNFEDIKNKGYIAIRPLIVYPQEHERTCVAQGILCPTVYNVEDRLNNQPFSQSSWFLRPNIVNIDYNIPIITSDDDFISYNSSGKWAEFRHNRNIQADALTGNGEIADFGYYTVKGSEGSYKFPDISIDPYIKDTSIFKNATYGELMDIENPASTKSDFENSYKNNFYVDRNVLSFHSPEITSNFKTEGLKLRIVGYVPITSSKSTIELETSTSEIGNLASLNHVNNIIKNYNKSKCAGRHLINGNFWYDYSYTYIAGISNPETTLYPIYPWNRSTGLSFTTSNNPTLLKKSRYSILQFSNNTIYTTPNDLNSEIKIFSEINNPLIKFSDGTNYVGNYNKIVTLDEEPVGYASIKFSDIPSGAGTVADRAVSYNDYITKVQTDENLNSKEARDFASYGIRDVDAYKNQDSSDKYHADEYMYRRLSVRDKISLIPITYKSSDHAVIKLSENKFLQEDNNSTIDETSVTPFWSDSSVVLNKTSINIGNPEYDYLFLGELYRDIDSNIKFGGTSDYAIQNNLWIPAGKTINLDAFESASSLRLTWSEGDTYYQRYDHVKTKPYDDSSLNGVTVIASFMCETRTNLDGRYDRNRIKDDYLTITDDNYNQINSVYSQQNNFFNYRVLDSERFNITKLPNSIVWSKTKLPNNIVDSWLNINLASTLDLDGNKGNITSLKRFNNEIIAFQDKAVSQVLYNTRTQISATDGVPIEIANSGKVDGKRYISDNIGCLNKWSICESPNGIYFIDDYNKSINIFNTQGIQSLSEMKGFHSWINNKSNVVKWNPEVFDNAITYRDPINNEILFVYKDTCLIYNELLNEFTSFYDYGGSYPFVNLNGRNIIFNNNTIYGYQEGEYNNIFGKNKEYYIDIIANENPLNDKIFTNIEFRADTYNDDESKILDNKIDLNTLSARNEYQHSLSKLSYSQNRPSNLKKKFRIWRADIPRDGKNRIRNTWTHIKLSSDATTNRKTRLHDLSVIYYV